MNSYVTIAICGVCIGCLGSLGAFGLISIVLRAKEWMIGNIFKREIYDINHEVD